MAKMHKLLKGAAKLARKAAKKAKRAAEQAKLNTTRKNNLPGAFVKLAQLPKDSRLARARMRGWNDVLKGKGFRESYDLWKKAAQLAYERGRNEATLARAAFVVGRGELTEWQMGELVQGPMYRAVGAARGEKIIDDMRKEVRSVK